MTQLEDLGMSACSLLISIPMQPMRRLAASIEGSYPAPRGVGHGKFGSSYPPHQDPAKD